VKADLLGFAAIVLVATLTTAPLSAAPVDSLAVEVVNKSEPTPCAEKDNVSIALISSEVRSFRIEATHPAYLPMLRGNSFEPDWTSCDMAGDPSFTPSAPPRRQTIYEDPDTWLVAWTFPSFWRPATATVRVGERVEHNIHLLQLWVRRPNGGEEILVLYPQDGYWRLRPLAPPGWAPTAFGSSFLIGPVEEQGRPLVRLKEVTFEPDKRIFKLSFEKGGTATVAFFPELKHHALEVAFDAPVHGGPFAMLRSMYVTETNNDVARIAIQEPGAQGRREQNIMAFEKAIARDIWTGRVSPSQHNASSPDIAFSEFSDTERLVDRK
jgi:hypothetical protein